MSDIAQQFIAMQEVVMHLQHELAQIHSVVLAQQTELTELRRSVAELRGNFERMAESDPFPTLEEERPPHY